MGLNVDAVFISRPRVARCLLTFGTAASTTRWRRTPSPSRVECDLSSSPTRRGMSVERDGLDRPAGVAGLPRPSPYTASNDHGDEPHRGTGPWGRTSTRAPPSAMRGSGAAQHTGPTPSGPTCAPTDPASAPRRTTRCIRATCPTDTRMVHHPHLRPRHLALCSPNLQVDNHERHHHPARLELVATSTRCCPSRSSVGPGRPQWLPATSTRHVTRGRRGSGRRSAAARVLDVYAAPVAFRITGSGAGTRDRPRR